MSPSPINIFDVHLAVKGKSIKDLTPKHSHRSVKYPCSEKINMIYLNPKFRRNSRVFDEK